MLANNGLKLYQNCRHSVALSMMPIMMRNGIRQMRCYCGFCSSPTSAKVSNGAVGSKISTANISGLDDYYSCTSGGILKAVQQRRVTMSKVSSEGQTQPYIAREASARLIAAVVAIPPITLKVAQRFVFSTVSFTSDGQGSAGLPVHPSQDSSSKQTIHHRQQNQQQQHDSMSTTSEVATQGAIQKPAGLLWPNDIEEEITSSQRFIPQIPLHDRDGRRKKRVLVLCTGGTLTMALDPHRDHALAPVEGALTRHLSQMTEITESQFMPDVVAHEYTPLLDSSDLGPSDWALLAQDIRINYFHYDGFVILMGTDTMAYVATALSFMLENLGKPVVVTGSQIPLCEPYNDARRNLIMALIFASRDTINEVTIFFHDRLLRACRATKVNTSRLLAFDSPNLDPLAKIGITIEENEHLCQPPARGALHVHTRMDTRLVTLRLVPGFDDAMMKHMIQAAQDTHLKGLVLQLYGTGNLPSVKNKFVQVLADAVDAGVCVVATTQCHTGSVIMGHYVTGRALRDAGVVSANDMTLEATSCKLAYLLGRGDLSYSEVKSLMDVSLRGEVTPADALPPPPLSSAYQRASKKGKRYL